MRRRQARANRSATAGYTLMVALLVITLVAAASAMIAGALGYRMWLVRQESRSLHLTALTDAAVARALAELSVDRNYSGTDGAVPFADGTIAIVARRRSLTQAVVDVRATYAGGGRAARADVNLLPLEVTRWQPVVFEP